MAIQPRKISSFTPLTTLSGDEVLMVAYKGKTYKLPVELLTGNTIQSIKQKVVNGDGAMNPISIQFGVGEDMEIQEFAVYNGQTGSKGPDGDTGEKGPQGDTGVAIYNIDPETLIYNDGDLNEKELSELAMSAAAGAEIQDKLDELEEVYLDSQDEFDLLVAKGEIKDNVKYFIFEE